MAGLDAVEVLVDVDAILEGRVYSWLSPMFQLVGEDGISQVVVDRRRQDCVANGNL